MPRPAEAYFLALDQGGHASRALVFSASGEIVAQAYQPLATHTPQAGWVEQHGAELLESLRQVTAAVHAALGRDAGRVRAAGLATQRSNCICWDRQSGAALSPALSWQDVRARRWLDSLDIDAAWLRGRTGLPSSPHYGASKLHWCLEYLPAVREAAEADRLACGPLASYLLFNLLRERPMLVDPANAARSLLWNLQQRRWDPELLRLFGIDAGFLPATVSTCHDFGSLPWGNASLPLRVTTGDQSAVVFADGPPRVDTLYINLGTGAFLQRPVAAPFPLVDGLLAGIVSADDQRAVYVHEATVNGAAAALEWLAAEEGLSRCDMPLQAWLQRSGEIPLFLNGVAGLGSPWWRSDFHSRFIAPGTTEVWARAVAVIESIVFLLAENLRLLQGAVPVQRLQISGGLASLAGLCQRLAAVTGLPVTRCTHSEATARGVACLLAQEAGCEWPAQDGETFAPQAHPACAQRYQRWRVELQQALAAP